MPDKVTLQITEAEAAVKGDTATGATKNAVLETGFVGDKKFSGRVNLNMSGGSLFIQ